MNNELENKLKSIADLVNTLGLGKEDVVKLMHNLISLHKISFSDLYPEMGDCFDKLKVLAADLNKTASAIDAKVGQRNETTAAKGQVLPFEVIYDGGIRSKQVVAGRKPVGIVLPAWGLLLYWQESYNSLSRGAAEAYLKNLPPQYDWRLMDYSEAVNIKSIVFKVNETLRLIGGDVLSSRDYMLKDDGKSSGYVRYVARI